MKIIKSKKHIADDDFTAFMAERLDERKRGDVMRHLGVCKKCRARFEELNFGDKTKNRRY